VAWCTWSRGRPGRLPAAAGCVLGACQRRRRVAWCGPMSLLESVTSKHGGTPEVREARRLFLYGGADGVRVLKVETLARLSGAHAQSIRKWVPAWEAELEKIVSNSSEFGLEMRLNAETLAKHESDCMKIRSCIDAQLLEIEQIPKIERELLMAVKRISDSGNPEAADTAVSLLARFFEAGNYRRTAEAHLLKLQSHWSKMAGIESLQSVAETREKTLASGRAKLRLRAEEAQGQAGPDGARAIGSGSSAGGVFAKRSPAPVELVGDDEV